MSKQLVFLIEFPWASENYNNSCFEAKKDIKIHVLLVVFDDVVMDPDIPDGLSGVFQHIVHLIQAPLTLWTQKKLWTEAMNIIKISVYLMV